MARAMNSGRSYLSIGDVLSLLRQEFPDVTISKIRFLESQGLVDPERSPSGYRKFYDEDVARLRWVLRKQRDQFLPLKVIRDRLAAAGSGVPPDDEPIENGEAEWSQNEAPAPSALRESGHAGVGAEAAGNGIAEPRSWAPTVAAGADEAEMLPAAAVPPAAGVPPAAAAEHSIPAPGSEEPAGLHAVAHSGAATAVAERDRREPATAPRSPASQPSVERLEHHPGAVAPPAAVRSASSVVAGTGMVTGTPAAAETLAPSVSGVSLTLAELCAATGLAPEVVASLEGLGLLAPMSIAGGTFYDEEALTVGKLVVHFGRYGVEPRHLRMYRNAADREVGLIEQVITPLLRQRNPEARQRAVDAAADLARLGQSMRASLVRNELRHQLGG